MMDDVEKILRPENFAKIYPDLQGMETDIAGFGWFQGWNDGMYMLCYDSKKEEALARF